MNAIQEIVQETVAGVAITDQVEGLSAFLHPDCAAAIWQRQADRDLLSWLDKLPVNELPQGRVVLQPSAVRSAVAELFEIANTPDCPERDQFEDDIVQLANSFAELMKTSFLRLKLLVVDNNACRKFHVDALTGRLVCTYRGTGTQYGNSTDDADPARVFTVPTGAPILLRGSLWPEEPASGLLHRSPPIEGNGETRLLLVLDAIAEPDGA
ncbi:MAG: DUF1826 domain-containing protein [Litoreibacter sp.]|uniref:DUF1826 domain-containing protein n=1 Tax=Litoreibacter sp. TaxID=1969459 RepID=UPI0032984CED